MSFLTKIQTRFAIEDLIKGNGEKALKKLNAIKKETYEVFYYKGICYFDLYDLEKAQVNLEKALDYGKEEADLVILLAQVYLLQKESEKALIILENYKTYEQAKIFIKLIKQGEKSIESYVKKTNLIAQAMTKLQKKDYAESLELFKKVLEVVNNKDEKANINNQIGGIYCNHLKNGEQAKLYFQKAIKLAPNTKVFRKNLARAQNL